MNRQILLICADRRRAVRTQVALLQCGCTVELAGTFRRGLAVIQHRPPTAIVIDEALPDFDRAQLAGVLRESPETAGLPVIVLALNESTVRRLLASELAKAPTGTGHPTPSSPARQAQPCAWRD